MPASFSAAEQADYDAITAILARTANELREYFDAGGARKVERLGMGMACIATLLGQLAARITHGLGDRLALAQHLTETLLASMTEEEERLRAEGVKRG